MELSQYKFAVGGLLLGIILTLIVSQYPGIIELHFGNDSSYVRVDGNSCKVIS